MSRRITLALAALAVTAPAALSAQSYFGQNKVQYRTFDFQILRTEHFDVHFYPAERVATYDAARMAERSYGRLSRILNHRFKERKVIILYGSASDFSQTNTTPGDVGEGTGGFTDFFKQRAILPLTGSYREIEHVLTHEMVHQFQLDVFSSGRGGSALQAVLAVQPPLWFMEGMAEFLSLGPTNPETAMWLRDAALEDKLPTIEQLTLDPRLFPYRYGHALWSYIAERWGDEAVGTILASAASSGIDGSIRRTLGLTTAQLSQQWHDAIKKQYLPEIGERVKASALAKETLSKAKSQGTLHLAPALSPDGTKIAYFSEKDFYFVDLYLADVATGKAERRLFKSTWSSNYETFRFINSQANWSPDGKYLAFAGKRGGQDDIIILDVARNKEVRRLRVDLNGVTTPAWSPDGRQLVFTGYDGGLTDLFIINADGSGLKRLTNDKYADLDPVWSPDGRSIAFTTDRGPDTDFNRLAIGNYRIAVYDVETGGIRVLKHMDAGKNAGPVWSPDGKTLAYVSDRDGVSNIYLYEMGEDEAYQITNFYTGVQGITPLSPVLTWAAQADRLAFVYYEKGEYNVYSMDNPRSLKNRPLSGQQQVARAPRPAERPAPAPAPAPSPAADTTSASVSLYRTPQGFRPSGDLAKELRGPDREPEAPPVSVVAMLDSVDLALPDTSEFQLRPYRTRYSADYVQRPTVGYVRDNYGSGVYGGTSITLSDNLGNHNLVFGGFINGRIDESQVLAQYVNLSHRLNWAVGVSQFPVYFLEAPSVIQGYPSTAENTYVTSYRRLVYRSVSVQGAYPLSRFQRLELGMAGTWLNDGRLSILEPFDPSTGFATRLPQTSRTTIANRLFVTPSLALVYDNALGGYIGPMRGRRYRFQVGQNVGQWRFTELMADSRRYDKIGPFTLATRMLYSGRIGRDANLFQTFIGWPELLRGHTSGSYFRNECAFSQDPGTQSGCNQLDQLIGSQYAVFNAELRIPLISPPANATKIFPPVEMAFFYDAGVAWSEGDKVKLSRGAGDDALAVRTPLQSYGASLRTNLLGFVILRLDYARPLHRPGVPALWTLSLGPTF